MDILVCSTTALAKTDSLSMSFDHLVGFEKVEAIKNYVHLHQNEKDSSLMRLAQMGLRLSDQKKSESYQVSFTRLIGSLLMARGLSDSAVVIMNNALKQAKALGDTDEIGEIEGVLGNTY